MSELSIKKIIFSMNINDDNDDNNDKDDKDNNHTYMKMKRMDCWIDTKTICETNKYPSPNVKLKEFN